MGDWYELKDLAGRYFIECQNEATEWQPFALEISIDKTVIIEDLKERHANELHDLLKSIAHAAK